jgi:hypothetical protein
MRRHGTAIVNTTPTRDSRAGWLIGEVRAGQICALYRAGGYARSELACGNRE